MAQYDSEQGSQKRNQSLAGTNIGRFKLPVGRATTTEYLSFGPMTQCVVHALKGLACHAPGLLAHDELTKNRILFSMGPNLGTPRYRYQLARWVVMLNLLTAADNLIANEEKYSPSVPPGT